MWNRKKKQKRKLGINKPFATSTPATVQGFSFWIKRYSFDKLTSLWKFRTPDRTYVPHEYNIKQVEGSTTTVFVTKKKEVKKQ